MSEPTLSIVNKYGSLNFDSLGNYECISTSHNTNSNTFYSVTAADDIDLDTHTGNLNIVADLGVITINSDADITNSIIIEATNSNGGILQSAGTGGITLLTSNGDIDILSQGENINIGVSPVGTPAAQQTQNVNIECFNNLNVSSGDMYFVSSDVISFVSNTGDIQFGTSSNGVPVIKFQDGNVLINQNSSNLDYQLDVAVTHPSDSKNGYNGIMVNTKESNVAADLTLQTSNTLGDGTQCIISIGAFGSNNKKAIFQSYLAYQTGNVIVRMDGPSFSPNSIDTGFGKDFIYSDIGREIYWVALDRLDTIIGLDSLVTDTNDASNITITGTYTGNSSLVYLLQIDSLNTPNTFKWSNNGGVSFQNILVSIVDTITPIELDNGLYVTFSSTTGFYINQQFTFQTKITAIVTNSTSIPTPTTFYSLQPFYSYIETTTPSDIVIKTNSSEKMRITGDGAIGIQKKIPTASLDLNSNYNNVLMVNQTLDGYQLNPSIGYLESGGYILVWNSQDVAGLTYDFNVIGQRYMSDGTRYGTNFQINNNTNLNQSFPSISGNKIQNSNHYIVAWASNNAGSGLYNIYCQIFHNDNPIRSYDIILDSTNPTTSNQLYPRVAGLYNGSYIVVWAADDANTGIYAINGIIIDDDATFITSKFQISASSPTLSRNYPYVAGFPSNDAYYPNGFVVGYMTAIDATADPRYTIAVRIFNYNLSVSSAEIPITSVGSTSYSSISDGLLSISEINNHLVNSANGGFVMSFYRSYQADTTLYAIGDNVSGVLSGATATISGLDASTRLVQLQNISNRFLVGEEIEIISTIPSVGNIIEKIAAITFITDITANVTLDVGSKNVVAYRFNSNMTSTNDALWNIQVNTSPLYNDLDRFTGNSSIYSYKRPLAAVSVDNEGTALITWSNGSIPSIYYNLINIDNGNKLIDNEKRLTSQYNGLKQRDQVVTHLQSIQGNDYGFVISWDNQSLDLQETGIYQQLIGYNHSLLNVEDGNSNFIFNHQNQLGVGTLDPQSTIHIKSSLADSYGDTPNPSIITLQNTSKHIITMAELQSIHFIDGSGNTLNKIQSVNSLRYDDLYPQPTNLKGFYKFDHTEGTQAVDYSSSSTFLNTSNVPVYINTNGILVNFDVENCWQSGIINNALLFNGVNNYVFVDNDALNGLNTILESIPKQMSISLWVKVPNDRLITNAESPYVLVANGGDSLAGNYQLYLIKSGSSNLVLGCDIYTDGVIDNNLLGTTIINDYEWHHIVLTVDIDGGNFYLYLDGVEEISLSSASSISAIQHQNIDTYFGSLDGTSNFFFGYMDELRFYNSVLSSAEITQLYTYGNPNISAKADLLIGSGQQPLVIDDDGKINNLSSRPLPYSVLSGELIAFSSNSTVYGIGTNFINELTIGDIIALSINQDIEFTVISISSNYIITLDRRGYGGPEASKAFQSVLRRPTIYTFFDNSDSIKGHIDNYGNMMIGTSKPTTMLDISSTSLSNNNIPEITITNTTQEDILYGRKTAINFNGYDTTDILNPSITLAHIETSHYGTATDNSGVMRFFVNNGVIENNLMTMTSNGNIGIGGQNSPLTLMHALTEGTTTECSFLMESNYHNSLSGSSIFDERSNIYFAGESSITETLNPDIKYRVLSAVSGSNDGNILDLTGRLDFLVNDNSKSVKNGIESKMCITYNGNVGVNILKPANIFNVAPERRLVSGEKNTILSTASGGTVITLSNNLFSGLTTEEKLMFVGGSVVIENDVLTKANIVSIDSSNQLTVDLDLSSYVDNIIYVHYAGLNVDSSNGFTGINTISPKSVLSVNGSFSLPIVKTTTDITINCTNYTVICDTTSNDITVTLPINSSDLNGRIYVIKKYSGSNYCYINPNGSNIDGSGSSYTVTTFTKIQSDGVDWWVIG